MYAADGLYVYVLIVSRCLELCVGVIVEFFSKRGFKAFVVIWLLFLYSGWCCRVCLELGVFSICSSCRLLR